GEHAGDAFGLVADEALRVARAVEALVIGAGETGVGRQHRAARQHALAHVRVQAHALAFGHRERTRLLPRSRGHGDAADVVHAAGDAGRVHAVVVGAEFAHGAFGKFAHPRRVVDGEHGEQVDKARHGRRHVVDVGSGDGGDAAGLTANGFVPYRVGRGYEVR